MKIESEFNEKYSQQKKNYEREYSEKEKEDQKQDVSMNLRVMTIKRMNFIMKNRRLIRTKNMKLSSTL